MGTCKINIALTLFLAFLLCVPGFASTSEIDRLNSLAKEYVSSNPDSSILLSKKAVLLSKQQDYSKGLVESLRNVGTAFYVKHIADSAIYYLLEANALLKSIDDLDVKLSVINNTGLAYQLNSEFDKAQSYFEKIINNTSNTDDLIKGRAFQNLGLNYAYQSEYDKAIDFVSEASKVFKKEKNQEAECGALLNLGGIYTMQEKSELAIEALVNALQVAKDLNDVYKEAVINRNIGGVMKRMERYQKAKEYYKSAVNNCMALGDNDGLAENLNQIGYCFLRQDNYDSSYHYLYAAIKRANNGNNVKTLSVIYNNLGLTYMNEGRIDSALHYYYKSLDIELEFITPNKKALARNYLNIGICYKELSKLDSAIALLNSSLTYSKQIQSLELQKLAYKELSETYKRSGDYSQAYENILQYLAINDSMTDMQKYEAIADLEAKYKDKEKQQQLTLLKRENTIKEIELEKNKSVITNLIILIVLGVIIAALAILISKQKTRRRIIELELKLLQDQMNPHFIFNALNSIQSSIITEDKMVAYDYHAKFAKLMRSILQNSREETTSIKEEVDMLTTYIELEQFRAEGKFDFSFEVSNSIEPELDHIPTMLIQPHIENAILHGILPSNKKGNIEIKINQREDEIVFTIQDNGVGFKKSLQNKVNNSHKSLATKVNSERIELYNLKNKRKIKMVIKDISDTQNTGTLVTILIPLKRNLQKVA